MRQITRKRDAPGQAALDARLELVPDPAAADAQGARGHAEPDGELAPALDLHLPFATIVVENQSSVGRVEAVEASVEAIESALAGGVSREMKGCRRPGVWPRERTQ